ncbi:urease accessory protein UreD [Cohnella mopanensis]|uniref:urease accessory protein UreD n=1 Tax=Cohnella mopanensis TaxID=2911966 RepID=UPI001EF90A14|nr:urease accessory protein UreD [Cohnella mopanensis]
MRRLSSLADRATVDLPIGADLPPVTERLSELRAVVGLANGRPELLSRYHTSPLKIAKTFALSNGDWKQLAVIQMDGSPGLLEGDRYVFDWELKEGARLYATNQAYTRVHPCESGRYSRLHQRFKLRAGSVMEWMPEPVMLFRDARFVSETDIDMDEGSVCVLGDIFCPGRLSRGEAFAFGVYDAKVTVRYRGKLIHYQRQKWEPSLLEIDNAGCFGSFTHLGLFSVFSDRISPDLVENVREALGRPGAVPEGVRYGVARTARHGLVVQAAGHAAWKLQRLLLVAWDSVRQQLMNQPPLRLLKEAWMSGVNN